MGNLGWFPSFQLQPGSALATAGTWGTNQQTEAIIPSLPSTASISLEEKKERKQSSIAVVNSNDDIDEQQVLVVSSTVVRLSSQSYPSPLGRTRREGLVNPKERKGKGHVA